MSTDGTKEMTDGCAGISPALMDAVSARLVAADPTLKGLDVCVVQMRLGPYKGLFYRDPAVSGAQVRGSMRKYSLDGASATHDQCCIEVNSHNTRLNTAMSLGLLNRQAVRLLEARGVPQRVLAKFLHEDIERMKRARTDVACLRGMVAPPREGADAGASWQQRSLRRCLGAGFALDSAMVQSIICDLLAYRLDVKKESKFELERSRRCFIIADPTGTLQPTQCYANISGKTLRQQVALIRSPCYDPGEVLVLDAVAPPHPQLSEIHGCVVLSSLGPRAVADNMQGGDYDGDDVLLIWEPSIVSKIDTASWAPPIYENGAPPLQENFAGLGKVGDVPEDELDGVLAETWLQAMEHEGTVGTLSNLHECWADIAADNWRSEAGAKAQELAVLCCHALDSARTGRFVTQDAIARYRSVSKPHYLAASGKGTGTGTGTGTGKGKGPYRQSGSAVARLCQIVAEERDALNRADLGEARADEDLEGMFGPLGSDRCAGAKTAYSALKRRIGACLQELQGSVDAIIQAECELFRQLPDAEQDLYAFAWYECHIADSTAPTTPAARPGSPTGAQSSTTGLCRPAQTEYST